MITISSVELQRKLGVYQDKAMNEPVFVTRNGRERIVMLSAEEYRRLLRRDREALLAEDFTDDELREIEASRAPAESAAFNHEMDR